MRSTIPVHWIALGLLCIIGTVASAATVTQSITYQGKLTDAAGNPLTGTYSVRFSLYDVATGGTALVQNSQSVSCTNGLFTTPAMFVPEKFDGRALWLGVQVGSDPEMTPRQEIRPVPYAISLRPGAWIAGTGTSPALHVVNRGGGPAVNISTALDNSDGAFARTTGYSSAGFSAVTHGGFSPGFNTSGSGDFASGFSAMMAGYSNDGVSVSMSGDMSDGVSVSLMGSRGKGVSVTTEGYDSRGFYALTEGNDAEGLLAKTTGEESDGIDVETTGLHSTGINVSTTADSSDGVWVRTSGFNSNGVYAVTTNDYSPGVNVTTSGDISDGVIVHTDGSNSDGIRSYTDGYSSNGVTAYTTETSSTAIYGHTSGTGSPGLHGHATGSASQGVYAYSSQYHAVYADTGSSSSSHYGVYTPDSMYAGKYVSPSGDVAEYMPVSEDVTPGTVLVIGPDGKLQPSAGAYDTRVAGIVSTVPGVSLGTDDDGNPGEALIAVSGRVPCKVDAGSGAIRPGDLLSTSDIPGHAMKAEPDIVNGRKYYPDGTVLGKAMGSLESGTGVIEVLVTLQ